MDPSGSKEFLLTPLQIWRNPNEGVLIEATINSVRVSVKIDTHGDSLEDMLLDKFQKFLVSRAERFIILRRKPLEVRSWHPCTFAIIWSDSFTVPRATTFRS